jgi:hypothetical protein
VGAEPPIRPLGRDPFQHVRHRRRFPFSPTGRGDAAPIESGGDLSERLRPSGLSYSNSRHDNLSVRVGPSHMGGIGDGASVG